MAAAEHLCAAFARHFFRAADDAVQQYACQVLLSSIEDGDGLQAQADALQDWLPPAASAPALAAGLLELQRALQVPGEQHAFAWLQQQPEQRQPADAVAISAVPAQAAAMQRAPSWHAPAGAAGEQQPAVARSGGLSIAAAEFKPGGAAASLSSSLGSLHLGSGAVSGEGCPDGAADAGWGEAEDGGAAGSQGSGWATAGGGQWASAAAAAEAAAAAGGGLAASGPAAQAAFLAVLGEQFPLFSADALWQLFTEQGFDFAATVSTLCSVEAELEGQAAAGGWGSGGAPVAGSPPQAAPSFSESDFPSLGPTSGGSTTGSTAGAASTAQYASRARAAAQLPAQGSRSSAARAAAPPPRAGAGAGPAPIWQQAEGVPQFATGAAAAAEYAALRADASDHARLRNAYFQQATQAYLAGNRAAAREMGAAGRWHNQQMHAAHAAAAQRQFAQRNPSGGGGGAAGAGSGTVGGVRTVDLHGLHVSEALTQVDALLAQHTKRGSGGAGARRLRVVVGVGSHGKVPSRLPAAVRRHLDACGVRYSEPYSGLLELMM